MAAIKTTGHAQKAFKPKKGRPTADQVSAINRVILTVATERFLADGYAATSMDAIAAHAGISKGTLYSRYANKELLLRAVVGDRVAAWSAVASQRDWMAGDTLEKRLKHHARTVMSWSASEEIRAFERLLDGAPEAARARNDLLYDNLANFLAGEIREYSRIEGMPVRYPNRVAVALLSAFAGWLRMKRLAGPVSEREAVTFAHRIIDMLIAGRAGW
jgi:AcrR family transcriptional regulator